MTASANAETFRRLHDPGRLLVLANVWDAASARPLPVARRRGARDEQRRARWAHGYADGGALPVDAARAASRRSRASCACRSPSTSRPATRRSRAVGERSPRSPTRAASASTSRTARARPTCSPPRSSAVKRAPRAARRVRERAHRRLPEAPRRRGRAPRGDARARGAYQTAGADGVFVPASPTARRSARSRGAPAFP